ncbi:MAG: cobalamin-binding protein [Pseudomonadota bacterium]|nr:cobalamin-binding protein [Pseudomonadota bacterium]
MMNALRLMAMMVACAWPASASAEVRVIDDRAVPVVLQRPAKRIISLAPHATELLFAAGAGDRIVGTIEFSDFPPAAKAIPRIGSSALLDLEQIVRLDPDLIVVWLHGNAQSQLDRLQRLGVPMFYTESRKLEDIPRALLQFGTLAGSESTARKAAADFSTRLGALRARYAQRSPVPLFWQVWARPLLTINGQQLINDVIRLCGGVNIYERAPMLVPAITIEAVVEANPEAIITTSSDSAADGSDGLDLWRKLPSLRATTLGNLLVLDAEKIHRQSPRILEGAGQLCEQLDLVRSRRKP